jgi:hypothetical protein
MYIWITVIGNGAASYTCRTAAASVLSAALLVVTELDPSAVITVLGGKSGQVKN